MRAEIGEAVLEGTPQHETIFLTPGSAVYRADGLLPAISESGEFGPTWSAPGDFVLFLEPGEDEHTGLVRELLVGSYRHPEDSDFEQSQGVFFTDPEWDFVSGSLKNRIFEMETQIGFLAGTEQLADQRPRAESWLAERSAADAEKARLDAEIAMLFNQLTAASARIKEIEAQLAATPNSEPELTPEPEPVVSEIPPKTKAGK